jgi:hypothetical protein
VQQRSQLPHVNYLTARIMLLLPYVAAVATHETQTTHHMPLTACPACCGLCPPVLVAGSLPACYSYTPQKDGKLTWLCVDGPDRELSIGISSNTRPVTNPSQVAPYDQGIVFFQDPRPGPYAKYNYIENVNTASPANTWQTLSFIGPGSTTTGAENCGCTACPSMTCNLAKAGPRTGALTPDTNYPTNMAYNPLLETCQSSAGTCLSMNGDACCVATSSYDYKPAAACSESCRNFFSGISKDRPLSALWSTIQKDLPVESPPSPPPVS